ncbi:MAG: hypothetical protein IKN96_03550 [Oscillibacter sp.]|nr:hypothetical protein [Oscillibacter sp.]
MKKRLFQFALIFSLMAFGCVAARAAEPTFGFRAASVTNDQVTLTPVDASGKDVEKTSDNRYPGAVKLKVSYSKAAGGSEYLLCVLKDDGEGPGADNMAYIDQKPATGSSVDFIAYPKKPGANETSVKYAVYLSGNAPADSGSIDSFTKVGSFEYYGEADVMLGDVDGNGAIEVDDALDALFLSVGTVNNLARPEEQQRAAANVDESEDGVDVGDALNILLCSVGTKTGIKALDDYLDSL